MCNVDNEAHGGQANARADLQRTANAVDVATNDASEPAAPVEILHTHTGVAKKSSALVEKWFLEEVQTSLQEESDTLWESEN